MSVNPNLFLSSIAASPPTTLPSTKQGVLPFIITLIITIVSLALFAIFAYYSFRNFSKSLTEEEQKPQPSVLYYASLSMVSEKVYDSVSSKTHAIIWDSYSPNVYDKINNKIILTRNGLCTISSTFFFTLSSSATLYLTVGTRQRSYPITSNVLLTISLQLPVREQESVSFYLVMEDSQASLNSEYTFCTLSIQSM